MTLGGYNIGYLLGSGADGEVRLATENTPSNRQFAVKILKVKNEDEKMRFKRELDVTRSLHHDNIIKFHDVKEHDGAIYLFMELIKGTTLEKYSEQNGGNGLPETVARQLFIQLANAVSFIHSKGICHRDIKLENVLVDQQTNKATLIDFGYCGLVQNGNSLFSDSVGSPLFNSPEKLMNTTCPGQATSVYCGKSSDVWSLGVCLFYMLNGYYPFFPYSSYGVDELKEQIINNQVYPNPMLSNEANDLLLRMLDKDPQKRITIHQVLEHSFVKKRNAI